MMAIIIHNLNKSKKNETRKIKRFSPVWNISFHHVFCTRVECFISISLICFHRILRKDVEYIHFALFQLTYWGGGELESNRKVRMKSRKQDLSIYKFAVSIGKFRLRCTIFQIVLNVLFHTGEVKQTGNTALGDRAYLHLFFFFLLNWDTES